MQPIVGIICEYDPFHLGHQRQFELIRAQFPDARIVCLMSGCFTQRGMPALCSPAARAQAALDAGADLALELPCAFAVRDAEHFALGGVSILTQLGFISYLSFGCEQPSLSLMQSAASLLESPTGLFQQVLRDELQSGVSFAAAQGRALARAVTAAGFPHAELLSLFSRPNNILAICYLRALLRLNSPLQPMPVLRQGDYHAQSLHHSPYPSATAVRAALRSGDHEAAYRACGYAPQPPYCAPESLDSVLLYALRQMDKETLRSLPDCNEGLENRLYTLCRNATSREELLSLLKTRRYSYTRLNRLCCHALLGMTAPLLAENPFPSYVRLLGFRKKSQDLISLLPSSSLPVISKAADGPWQDPLYRLDEKGYDTWALGAGLPAGLMKTQRIQIV